MGTQVPQICNRNGVIPVAQLQICPLIVMATTLPSKALKEWRTKSLAVSIFQTRMRTISRYPFYAWTRANQLLTSCYSNSRVNSLNSNFCSMIALSLTLRTTHCRVMRVNRIDRTRQLASRIKILLVIRLAQTISRKLEVVKRTKVQFWVWILMVRLH